MGNLEETGNDLIKLSGPGVDSEGVEDKLKKCQDRYDKLKEQTEERGIKIGITLQQEEQIELKLEELLFALEKRKEDFGNLEPISVRPEKIQEQVEAQKVSTFLLVLYDTKIMILRMQSKMANYCMEKSR